MSVDPLKSSSLPQADAGRVGAGASSRRPEAGVSGEATADQSAPPSDRVQLSAASRTLVEQTDEAGRVPQGTLDPERLREVLRRLAGEFYHRTDVRDAVADGVRRDLGRSTPE
jgi:hypothetical protein